MSSGGYGRYESAEAREARLRREALLGWEKACAERHALALRVRHESGIRGDLEVVIPVATTTALSDLTAAQVQQRTAPLRRETDELSSRARSAIETRSRANVDVPLHNLVRDILSDVPVGAAWSAPTETNDATPAEADASMAERSGTSTVSMESVDEAIRRELRGAISAGLDGGTFAELIVEIRRAPTPAHALFEVGRLREEVDAAIARQTRAARERDELEGELNRIAAAFLLAPSEADLPHAELEAARAQVARGEPVPPPVMGRLSAAAQALEDDAIAALRELNTRTSHDILVDAFAARGYRTLPLTETLVVENGELVSRATEALLGLADEPDHAVRLRLRNGQLEVQEVRLTAGVGADHKLADRRFEERWRADLDEVQRDARGRGVDLELTLVNVAIPTISTTATATPNVTSRRPTIASKKPSLRRGQGRTQ